MSAAAPAATPSPLPLSRRQLEQALDEYLDPVLSSRRTAQEPASGLAALPRAQQDFALHWVDVIAKSNAEMAYQFASYVPKALATMGTEGTRIWLLRAMDVYDKAGLYPGSAAFARLDEFAREHRLDGISVTLDEVRPVLERFLRGLSGRSLAVEAGERIYTDTETIYLPARISRFAEREQNYRLYKAMAVHLWAQSRFGTFRRATPDAPHLSEWPARFDSGERALELFNLLETIRLTACIKRELPGLFREINALDQVAHPQDEMWMRAIDRLEDAHADVTDTLETAAALYPLPTPWPKAPLYQGELDLEAARLVIERRLARGKNRLQRILGELRANADADTAGGEEKDEGDAQSADKPGALDPNAQRDDGEATIEINEDIDGEALALPPEVGNLLNSLRQDLRQLPPDWLVAAGDGAYPAGDDGRNAQEEADAPAEDALRYDEWDFRRQSYRKKWCVLRESASHPVHDDFAARTLAKHRHLVAEIRRHFEALRDQDKLLKAQPGGDDIDLDALVTACADARTGVEMSERLFTRMHKVERDLAVLFMVDVSGSTKGWINEAERESLLLLCEALEVLGDQYAIYGFSGMTRNRCEIYRVKTFEQPYDGETRARISGLRPQDYTRMGAAIRHLSKILARAQARTRVLITLSDGKPDDYDGYRGDYGIEDTRRALLEARHAGIHPFCITIDTEAGCYLPHMYGPAGYAVVDAVGKLPLKVADIYRKLTT